MINVEVDGRPVGLGTRIKAGVIAFLSPGDLFITDAHDSAAIIGFYRTRKLLDKARSDIFGLRSEIEKLSVARLAHIRRERASRSATHIGFDGVFRKRLIPIEDIRDSDEAPLICDGYVSVGRVKVEKTPVGWSVTSVEDRAYPTPVGGVDNV